MGRRTVKRTKNKKFFSKSFKMSNSLYILNSSVNDIVEIFDSSLNESKRIIENIIISGVSMLTMAQISLSALPENAEYVDKLPSYRDIKKKFITGPIGRTLAACSGIASAYPYLMQDPLLSGDDNTEILNTIVLDMVDNPSPNTRRIRPSIPDWQLFAKGEAGAAMGQMISCPSTNFKTVNIQPEVLKYNLTEAIGSLGINKEILNKHNITPTYIAGKIRNTYLVGTNGIPINKLIYDEPDTIHSKIQSEILKDEIQRSGLINTNLVKGQEPNIAISKTHIEKYLNRKELIAYKFAINTGDKNILKKYTDMIKERAKSDQ